MHNGVGLSTPCGSGTTGYVQSNRFSTKAKTNNVNLVKAAESLESRANKEILEHDRKRKIEVKLLVLEERLIEEGSYTSDEILNKLNEARKFLEAAEGEDHDIAKDKEMAKLKSALGI